MSDARPLSRMLVIDDDRRTTKSLVLAGLAAGFALFVKVPALFFVVAAFIGLTWFGRGVRSLLSRRTLAFAALTVPLLEFGDFAMMRKMLRGIKARAGASASSRARAGGLRADEGTDRGLGVISSADLLRSGRSR